MRPSRISFRCGVRGKILVTTLAPQEASKNALGALFTDRWPVEVDLRHLKTTLGMEVLKCKTAEMCEKELWVYFLAYNLIRWLMAEAAWRVDAVPRQVRGLTDGNTHAQHTDIA